PPGQGHSQAPPDSGGAGGLGRGPVRGAPPPPHPARQVLVLHYLVDRPVDQVAHTLRMPEGTVKSLLSRGRQLLASNSARPRRCWTRNERPAGATPRSGQRGRRVPGR